MSDHPYPDAIQFTMLDVAAVSQALDIGMNEVRSHRMYRAFVRAIEKDGKQPIDVAWALAQTLNGLIRQGHTEGDGTLLLRSFITMVALVEARLREQEHETLQ